MWTMINQAELRQLNGTGKVSPASIICGEMAWGRKRWFRLMYGCCIISCYKSFIACLIMTLVVIASQYSQLRAISYNPLLIPYMHTRILEQITIVWLRLRPSTNSKVKLWCQDMSRPNFLSPAVFPHEFAPTFPVQTHSSHKWCNENVVFFHKLLLGKASPVLWCMWSKNSV